MHTVHALLKNTLRLQNSKLWIGSTSKAERQGRENYYSGRSRENVSESEHKERTSIKL